MQNNETVANSAVSEFLNENDTAGDVSLPRFISHDDGDFFSRSTPLTIDQEYESDSLPSSVYDSSAPESPLATEVHSNLPNGALSPAHLQEDAETDETAAALFFSHLDDIADGVDLADHATPSQAQPTQPQGLASASAAPALPPPPPSQPVASGASNNAASQSVYGGYGDDLAGRPPIGASFPLNIQLGAIEILSFCPRWLHHPDVVLRLFKNGWRRDDIGKAQLHAVGRLNSDELKRVAARTQKQVGVAGRLRLGIDDSQRWDFKQSLNEIHEYDDLTANAWQTRHEYDPIPWAKIEFEHVKLVDIAAPIVNFPQGQDRLLFTQCVEYAVQHQRHDLTTADCERLIQQQGFVGPGPLDSDHDLDALERLTNAVPTPPETAAARQARLDTQKKSRDRAG